MNEIGDMEPTMNGRLDAPWCFDVEFQETKERRQWLGFWLAFAINLWCFLR